MKNTIQAIFLTLLSTQIFAAQNFTELQDVLLKNKQGIIIMDLDETVIDTHSRKYISYMEAQKTLCGLPSETLTNPKSPDCEKALGLSKIDFYRIENGYSSTLLMQKLSLTDESFITTFNKMMVTNYLSGKWMETDSSIPGASPFVRSMKRSGAQVYFISSRYEELQSVDTLAQLMSLGFIDHPENANVILRKKGQDSLSFKKEAVQRIALLSGQTGIPVIGLFENEPENLNAWKKVFPEASAYLIKGNILVPTELDPNIKVIEDYR